MCCYIVSRNGEKMIKNIQQMFCVACVSTCLSSMSNKANAMNWQQPYNNNNMFNNNMFNAAAPFNPANQGFQQQYNNYPPALNINIPNPGNQSIYISPTVNIFLPPNTGLNIVENPGFQQPIYNHPPVMPNPPENINPGFQPPYNYAPVLDAPNINIFPQAIPMNNAVENPHLEFPNYYPIQQCNNNYNNQNANIARLIEDPILLHREFEHIVEEIKSVRVDEATRLVVPQQYYYDDSGLQKVIIHYGLFILDFLKPSNKVNTNEKNTITRTGCTLDSIQEILQWYKSNYQADYRYVFRKYQPVF